VINMILLDLDPNVVKPGWTALIVTAVLAAAIVLLYLSLRKQMRRINVPYADDEPGPDAEAAPQSESVADGTADAESTTETVPSTTNRPAG
jgi:hypothetical protein